MAPTKGKGPAGRPLARLGELPAAEGPRGIFRTTLAWNGGAMVCHFRMRRGAAILLHSHPSVQAGYIISGRVSFQRGAGGDGFIAEPGVSYVFDSGEPHGATVLEDAEVVECFTPARPEYA